MLQIVSIKEGEFWVGVGESILMGIVTIIVQRQAVLERRIVRICEGKRQSSILYSIFHKYGT